MCMLVHVYVSSGSVSDVRAALWYSLSLSVSLSVILSSLSIFFFFFHNSLQSVSQHEVECSFVYGD